VLSIPFLIIKHVKKVPALPFPPPQLTATTLPLSISSSETYIYFSICPIVGAL